MSLSSLLFSWLFLPASASASAFLSYSVCAYTARSPPGCAFFLPFFYSFILLLRRRLGGIDLDSLTLNYVLVVLSSRVEIGWLFVCTNYVLIDGVAPRQRDV
ncbi:hypothetical protein BU26DRAFT_525456 [Trematosphaeria pertusa]|uniref:Secreted peptide n=1 Tax=Trematosphaeria pertusa TaxID=390896 RepID=A0A6A6HSX5_9PLEO|nr:uncharacterized protein BU26DRAFT_525456 [Trematosphaeria pertusa]KAF2241275.1 hypothetical protein BU26DRAFT_525456 [Trematosphaeria pertusa]